MKNPSLEYATACCKFDSCGSHLTVVGHVTNVLFSVISGHLNNVIIKQNCCFDNNSDIITHICFKIKQKLCKRELHHKTFTYLLQTKQNKINKEMLNNILKLLDFVVFTQNCRTWTRCNYQQVCHKKSWTTSKNFYKSWLVVNYLQIYVISTCFAATIASTGSFLSGM